MNQKIYEKIIFTPKMITIENMREGEDTRMGEKGEKEKGGEE